MKNARASGRFFWFLLISILASTKEIVGKIGATLIRLVSCGCDESDHRKGLTKFSFVELEALTIHNSRNRQVKPENSPANQIDAIDYLR
jgi:hypothetical protein